MRIALLFLVGVVSGGLIALQSVLNAGLGRRTGSLGSVLLLSLVSILIVLALIVLFPASASLKALPGPREWYLYAGGALGIAIIAATVVLVPRIGAATTLAAVVVGQLATALVIDHFGLLGAVRYPAGLARIAGLVLLVAGAVLVARK